MNAITGSHFDMSIADIGTLALAGAAVLGLIIGAISWFYKRGADERALATAVRDNSKATRELTARLEGFMARYEERHEALAGVVAAHDTRLAITETRVRANALDIARLWPTPGAASRPAGDPHPPDAVPISEDLLPYA